MTQPKTTVKFNRQDFDWVKRTIKLMSKTGRERKKNPKYASSLPEEIGIQLTYRCNLRCSHCYQWNESGFFHDIPKEKQHDELDVAVIEKLLRVTHESQSRLYLWGGEPLVHREWEAIAGELEKDMRWTVICTNGLLLEEKLESILRISPKLVLFIGLDGFREEHDALRGKEMFAGIMQNLALLLSLRKKGEYKGKISIHCVLNEQIVFRLFDFMEFCESLELDSIYFTFPWYISKQTAARMDEYYKTNFAWLNPIPEGQKPSWHCYTYHLDPSITDTLKKQLKKLNSKEWKIRIRLQPPLESNEIRDFVLGSEKPAQKKCRCLAVSNRMNVEADGGVIACKFFPEFNIGNVYNREIIDIWRSEKFGKVREIIDAGLMPVCSKCILLYYSGL